MNIIGGMERWRVASSQAVIESAIFLQFVCGLDKGFNFPEHFKFSISI